MARRTRLARGRCPMPDSLTAAEVDRLLKLGAQHGFRLEEIQYGTLRTRMWWKTREVQRSDWVMVILNAMHSGWGLKGFGDWKVRGMQQRYLRKLGLVSPVDGIRQDREGNHIINDTLRLIVARALEKRDG